MALGQRALDSLTRATEKPRRGSSRKAAAERGAELQREHPKTGEPWKRVNVVLMNRQTAALDRLAADIRVKTGAAISRAELIRAMVDAVLDSRLDLTGSASEAEVKGAVAARLKR